jgi:hypothetical protein
MGDATTQFKSVQERIDALTYELEEQKDLLTQLKEEQEAKVEELAQRAALAEIEKIKPYGISCASPSGPRGRLDRRGVPYLLACWFSSASHAMNAPAMRILARGRVVDGHLRVDIPVDLPDNTEVEFQGQVVETEDERALRESIARSDDEIARGEEVSLDEVLAELRSERTECRATG